MTNENLTAETNSSLGAKEVADFVVLKDRHGYEHNVINFDNPKYAPFTGMVELVPLKMGRGMAQAGGQAPFRHKNHVSFSVTRDKDSGMLIGLHNGYDNKTGELRWDKITLEHTEVIDLSIPRERKKYICIKYGPFFIDSPNRLITSKTVYAIVDKEREASEFVKNRATKKKASEIAESLWGEELNEFAMVLGYDPKLMSPAQLSMEVIKFAESDQKVNGKTGAQRFMEAYNSDTRTELIIFRRGLQTGIIQESVNGFLFNGLVIGFNEAEAVHYLKEHPATSVSIDTQSRGKYTHNTKSTLAKPTEKDAENAEIANLKRQLEQAKSELTKASERALEGESMASIANDDPELAALLDEGNRLGIKGIHLLGRTKPIDERKQLIEEKIKEFSKPTKN
jgi:hypothetical protein